MPGMTACDHSREVASNGEPVARDAESPRRVGPYELLLRIANGGMASVFLARKRGAGDFERNVALKLTHAHLRDQAGWAAELIEEAKLAARIRHPNVVQVLDVEDDPHGVFLVMEYVEGDTLSALVKHSMKTGVRLPRDVALRILVDALQGLHAAHEVRDDNGRNAGLVHRDFTPQNILVGLDGVARLTDFGVAKAETRTSYTATGTLKGKTGYMAPEQVRGQGVDRRADIWAAGVVAWEALAGRRLYPPGGDPIATLVQAATKAPERLSSVVPDIPPALDDTVAGALSLDRDRRFPTAEAFAQALVASCDCELADAAIVADHVEMISGARLRERREELALQRDLRALSVSEPPPPHGTLLDSVAPSGVVVVPKRKNRSFLALLAIAALATLFILVKRDRRSTATSASTATTSTSTSTSTATSTSASTSPSPSTSASTPLPSASTMVDVTPAPSSKPLGHKHHTGAAVTTKPPSTSTAPTSTTPVAKPLASSPYE